MNIELSDIDFDNDMFYITLTDGSILILTNINECFEADSLLSFGKEITYIKRIILSRYNTIDNSVSLLSTVINSSEDMVIAVKSDYNIVNGQQISGQILTQDNKDFCYIYINEERLLMELVASE